MSSMKVLLQSKKPKRLETSRIRDTAAGYLDSAPTRTPDCRQPRSPHIRSPKMAALLARVNATGYRHFGIND